MSVKRSLRHFLYYQATHFLEVARPFILLPITTRILSTEQFGVLKNLQNFSHFLGIFYLFYVSSAYTRFFYDQKDDRDSLRLLTSTCFYFLIALGVVLLIPSYVACHYYLRLIDAEVSANTAVAVVLIPGVNLLAALPTVSIAYLTQTKRNAGINIVKAVNFAVSISIIISCLLYFRFEEASYFYGALAANLMLALFGVTAMIRHGLLGKCFSFDLLKPCLKLSIASLPFAFSSWIYNLSSQTILAVYGGVALSGKFALTYKLGRLVHLIYLSFYRVADPYWLRYLTDHTRKQERAVIRHMNIGLGILVAGALFIGYFGQWILHMLAPAEYHLDPVILIVIVLSFVCFGIRKFTDTILWYHKRLLTMFFIVGLIPAALNLVLNLIFIPIFLEYAATITTFVSAFSVMGLSIFINSRIEKIPFDRTNTAILLFILLIGSALNIFLAATGRLTVAYIVPLYSLLLVGIAVTVYHRGYRLFAERKEARA